MPSNLPKGVAQNFKRIRGKRKGQFVKKNIFIARENQVKSIIAKGSKKEVLKNKINTEEPDNQVAVNRIVNLTLLAEQLWCQQCNVILSLKNIVDEQRHGLASIFTVACQLCKKNYKITTDEEYNNARSFKINSMAALGIIDAGIGISHFNALLSALNIPIVPHVVLKKSERIVGPVIERVATESCADSIILEKQITKEKGEVLNDNVFLNKNKENTENSLSTEITELKAGFDCGWQKRGTGRSYNSLSGHGTLIGHYSGKVLSYAVRCADCRFCKAGNPKTNHDCRKNFDGTAKAMEPDMAVELLINNPLLQNANAKVTTLISDDDSSTPATIRRLAPYEIVKWSDYNHTSKSFTSGLYALKLSRTLIEYFSHCFSHAVKQNKGDANLVKRNLLNIVPHAYGEHTHCGEWCKSMSRQYTHKNLPGGKPLRDLMLRNSLNKLILRYANNAEKISPCGSTQANESLNSMIAQKSIKMRHYAGSESLCYRVSAAICQKNLGCIYIAKVYEKLQFVIGPDSIKFRNNKDLMRKKRALSCKNPSFKKKRLILKKIRCSKNAAKGKKEGFSYESSISLNSISELISNSVNNDDCIKTSNLSNCKIVLFDLETTGLSKNDEICQIAASTDESKFNVYVIPSRGFSKKASEITQLQVLHGDMYLKDNLVEAVSASAAFAQFLVYLKQFGCPVILVAHNGFRFDSPRILKLAADVGSINEFKNIVYGFADTLTIIRKLLPDRLRNKRKFSIEALATDFLPRENLNSLHNANEDIKILNQILEKLNVTKEVIKNETKGINTFLNKEKNEAVICNNRKSLEFYKENISGSMINKMAKANINQNVLQEAFERGGSEGIRALLGENINGKARVTTNKKVLNKICSIFCNV